MKRWIRMVARTGPLLACALAVTTLGTPVRAANVYAYAQQNLTGFSFTGASITSTLLTQTGASASLNGSGPATNNALDAPEAFAGNGALDPGDNSFGQVGQAASDYIRGDSLIITPGYTPNSVAEGNLTTVPSDANGVGNWNISAEITLGASGTITLAFTYSNKLQVVNNGLPSSLASAQYAFDFTLVPLSGPGGSPTGSAINITGSGLENLNQSISVTNPGSLTVTHTGLVLSLTSGTLAAGTYTAAITGSTRVQLTTNVASAAVPEPSTVALAGLGALGGLVGLRRRRARA